MMLPSALCAAARMLLAAETVERNDQLWPLSVDSHTEPSPSHCPFRGEIAPGATQLRWFPLKAKRRALLLGSTSTASTARENWDSERAGIPPRDSVQLTPSTDDCGPERLPAQIRPSAVGVVVMSPISQEASPVVDCHVWPKSSVRAMPRRSPPTNTRSGLVGSKAMEVIRPPTPGSPSGENVSRSGRPSSDSPGVPTDCPGASSPPSSSSMSVSVGLVADVSAGAASPGPSPPSPLSPLQAAATKAITSTRAHNRREERRSGVMRARLSVAFAARSSASSTASLMRARRLRERASRSRWAGDGWSLLVTLVEPR